jgi:uroporphyrinogen-III decarboxylase
MDLMHERYMENLHRMLEAQVVDLYRICGPEYATPPYLPNELFTRFVKPYVTEMTELIHSKGALVRLHSHGRVNQALETIAATGCDALDPVEAPPDGDIELAEVKRRVGDQMCIFGNIQLKMLESGTPDEVEAKVRQCLSEAMDGGGYVIMPTASPISTPLSKKTEANYLRFFESALKYGQY